MKNYILNAGICVKRSTAELNVCWTPLPKPDTYFDDAGTHKT